jgi:hypothetical protein
MLQLRQLVKEQQHMHGRCDAEPSWNLAALI